MRYSILLLSAFLAFGCSTKSAHQEDPEIITRFGVIMAKEDASLNDVENDTKANTSVYGSISTGGRFSIGLGFLLAPFSSGDSARELVRYEVDLQDGGQFTIYLESRDFEVGDCVEITVHPDEEKNPPRMKRNKDAC